MGVILALDATQKRIIFGLSNRIAGTDRITPCEEGVIEIDGSTLTINIRKDGGSVYSKRLTADSKEPVEIYKAALGELCHWLSASGITLEAISHRVLHGGDYTASPVVIDRLVLAKLARLAKRAPARQTYNLLAAFYFGARFPAVLHLAFFDTVFHQQAQTTNGILPTAYAFDGLACEYIASQLPTLLAEDGAGVSSVSSEESNVIVVHLDGGSTVCAMRKGKSVSAASVLSVKDKKPEAMRQVQEKIVSARELDLEWKVDAIIFSGELSQDSEIKEAILAGLKSFSRVLVVSEKVNEWMALQTASSLRAQEVAVEPEAARALQVAPEEEDEDERLIEPMSTRDKVMLGVGLVVVGGLFGHSTCQRYISGDSLPKALLGAWNDSPPPSPG